MKGVCLMKRIYFLIIALLVFTVLSAEDPIDFRATYLGFGNSWEISFTLTQTYTEELSIWYPDEAGREKKVRILYNKTLGPGTYTFHWDGLDELGNRLEYRAGQNVRYRNGKVVMLK